MVAVRFRLSRRERRALERFVGTTKDKVEYMRGTALLMRSRGKKVKEVSKELRVSMGAVFKWQRMYRKKKDGLEGLKRRKQTGRPPIKGEAARKVIPELMKKDPKLFGFLKGRWVLRDISKALKKSEGIEMSPGHVHSILHELGLSYKRPKLTVESTDPQYKRKEREVVNYKKIAPALQKRGS